MVLDGYSFHGRCLRGTFIYRLKSNLGSSSINILGLYLFFRKNIFLISAPSPAVCQSLTVNWACHLHGVHICQQRCLRTEPESLERQAVLRSPINVIFMLMKSRRSRSLSWSMAVLQKGMVLMN